MSNTCKLTVHKWAQSKQLFKMTAFSRSPFSLVEPQLVIVFYIYSLHLHPPIIQPAVDSDFDVFEPSCDFIHV